MLAALVFAHVMAAANAIPMADPQGYAPLRNCPVNYAEKKNLQVYGESTTGGIYCPAGKQGCTIGKSESYSVSTTVTVGADLGLDLEAVSASISTQYSYTTTKGSTDTGTDVCPPGPWSCGLQITPSMLKTKGVKSYLQNSACILPPGAEQGDYEVEFPITTEDSGVPVIEIKACTCPEQPGAHAKGALPLCPNDCNLGGD